MIFKKNKVIFGDYVKNNDLVFNYIDVGARGDISSPWLELEKHSRIIGFEPDADEAKHLNKLFKNRKYFDIALWSEKTSKAVYINEWESTSSMYKPNIDFIRNFQPKHWEGRIIKSSSEVECETMDNILLKEELIPDFIKIDTQGSEYDILKGAKQILSQYAPLVTCETWCAEVYKDAPKMHKIISLMDSLGYQVFHMELAAAWHHGKKPSNCKRKSIGYEILFVKISQLNYLYNNRKAMMKFILLLELYGYRDFACFILDKCKDKGLDSLKKKISLNQKNDMTLFNRILIRTLNLINKIRKTNFNIYPNIKY